VAVAAVAAAIAASPTLVRPVAQIKLAATQCVQLTRIAARLNGIRRAPTKRQPCAQRALAAAAAAEPAATAASPIQVRLDVQINPAAKLYAQQTRCAAMWNGI